MFFVTSIFKGITINKKMRLDHESLRHPETRILSSLEYDPTIMTTRNTWYVYFLRCNDNSLYAGITTDINRRLHQHNHTKLGAKYTRAKRPVTLAFIETASDKSTASKREYQLRKLTKIKKEQLVSTYLAK